MLERESRHSGQWSEVTMPRALTERRAPTPHTKRAAECSTGCCEQYQEMLRLRRNLHDGLGPGLAGIILRAEVLTDLMPAGQPAKNGAAEEMLRELRHE